MIFLGSVVPLYESSEEFFFSSIYLYIIYWCAPFRKRKGQQHTLLRIYTLKFKAVLDGNKNIYIICVLIKDLWICLQCAFIMTFKFYTE